MKNQSNIKYHLQEKLTKEQLIIKYNPDYSKWYNKRFNNAINKKYIIT